VPVTYEPPVDAPVIDPIRPPPTPYTAGNRGVDYGTTPGELVRAAAGGQVTFAGQVGGVLNVVVLHGDGIRTSYSLLASIRVAAGQVVTGGQPVGTAGADFHLGARAADAYVDPAMLFDAVPVHVRLVSDGPAAVAPAAVAPAAQAPAAPGLQQWLRGAG
jgi:murein DD-endopeptidase MepM/ murein hydrolase activator NlpD